MTNPLYWLVTITDRPTTDAFLKLYQSFGVNVSLRNFSYWGNVGRHYWWMLLRWLINMPCWLWRNLKNIYVILALSLIHI